MSRAIKQTDVMVPGMEISMPDRIKGLLPVILPFVVALAFIGLRLEIGERAFLYSRALTMLALISYICASVLLVTNLFVKERVLDRLGLFAVATGFSFGFAGWMVRWIEAGDKEGWASGSAWRYYPLDNLHALTLGFVCGAALTTLVIVRRPKYRMLGALSLPILTVVLATGILMGDEINTLQPILDSYWRPIHVSIATLGYGVCLMSFGIAFAFLLKDGIRSEAIAIAILLFGVFVYGTLGSFDIPSSPSVPSIFHGEYGTSIKLGTSSVPLRATLPLVGPLMILVAVVILAALLLFAMNWNRNEERARARAWKVFGAAAILQGIVVAVVFYQVANLDNLVIAERYKQSFGPWLVEKSNMTAQVDPSQYKQVVDRWIEQQGAGFKISAKSNPVEIGALIGLFVALLMGWLLMMKRGVVEASLPAIEKLDGLLYRTVGVAFPLLSLLLITGAVWANESWGRYWGWDSKEVGALVSWMAYAGYLHTRIAHGWRGKKSAYFALLGFILIIFTWLGVSYLLPGLHSYAQ